nr:hypothetical protein [Allomuricauda sp.]
MRIYFQVLALMLLSLGCSSQKDLAKAPPIDFGNPSCRQWYGGTEQSDSGLLLEIPVLGETSEIEIKQAFFRGKITDFSWETRGESKVLIADFKNPVRTKPDIVMDADPKKEVGNQPPSLNKQEDFPFELDSSEAILSYLEKGKIKYYKIVGVKEKKPLLYQERPKN